MKFNINLRTSKMSSLLVEELQTLQGKDLFDRLVRLNQNVKGLMSSPQMYTVSERGFNELRDSLELRRLIKNNAFWMSEWSQRRGYVCVSFDVSDTEIKGHKVYKCWRCGNPIADLDDSIPRSFPKNVSVCCKECFMNV